MGDSSEGTTDPEPDSLRESESEQNSESDSESESKSESSLEGISPVHSLRQRRIVLRGFTARVNLCNKIRLYMILIQWRSPTLLSERHARIFWSGCSHRAILVKHVASFATVARHHLFARKEHPFGYYHRKKVTLLVSLDLLPRGRF